MAALAGVALTVISQVLLKVGVGRAEGRLANLFLNKHTVGAYGLLVVVTLLNLYAYRVIPLKAAVVLLPLTLLLVWVVSRWLLEEKFSRTQIAGALLILLGASLFFV